MEATRRYRLSRRAEADLEEIFAYTARTWSPRQAHRYLDGFEEALDALAAGERAGRPRPELGSGHHVLAVGSHFIVYREAGDVFVVRILHQSCDLTRHLGPSRR